MKRSIGFALLLLSIAEISTAQSLTERYKKFQKAATKRYETFRAQANARFAQALGEEWLPVTQDSIFEKPERKLTPPEEYKAPEEGEEVVQYMELSAPEVYTASYAEITEQPKPIEKIESNNLTSEKLYLSYFGTPLSFRIPTLPELSLQKFNEKEYVNAWKVLAGEDFDNLLYDCLDVRDKCQLCDYAYMLLLDKVSKELYGDTPSGELLKAFLYAQSGYAMRLFYCPISQKLHMGFRADYTIYGLQFLTALDGKNYYILEKDTMPMHVSKALFQYEQPMSLKITNNQLFGSGEMFTRITTSSMGVTAPVTINKQSIAFFQNYPMVLLNDIPGSQFLLYASVPMDKSIRKTLYPALKESIKGYSQRDGVNKLLNYVQTAFDYALDDTVWGGERIFFPMETLYYDYSDCEDRSILFARLVRDLFDLDVAFLLFEGHLATAVNFEDEVRGDYYMINGDKYVVCDPTYIGSSVGQIPERYRNAQVKFIKLQD